MSAIIFNPLEEFEKTLQNLHSENTTKYLQNLVEQSKVNVEENRETVEQYNTYKENLKKLKKSLNRFRFLRVLMIITLVLIPLVVMKITPKIRLLREEIEAADKKAEELLALAHEQMLPLNRLFTDKDALNIIESTLPLLKFAPCFTAQQEEDMRTNYDFQEEDNDDEQSTLEVLSGHYNENPFLFENKVVHRMGTETYHGSKTIYWTETYRDANGRLQTRSRSQTLHASVVKPKPFYDTQVILNYGAQGAPDLTFSRDASHLERKSEKEIERLVKRGEKKLKRKTDKAVKNNEEFMSMSNSDFEVLFDALDRTNEVQFRTLFTPLAQTNMVSLILSKIGFGDDFNFIKNKRMNKIITHHSQGRVIKLVPSQYISYSYDEIKENFESKNKTFFKDVYFDFAPILAIPAYQERPVHSLKPISDLPHVYSRKECEVLANAVNIKYVVHPDTKTQAILKSNFVSSKDNIDETCITAYSYDIFPRVDIVSVKGDDGYWHDVPVPWDEYIPLETSNHFYVANTELVQGGNVMANKNGLCIFSKQ